MSTAPYKTAITDYIRANARPTHKFSHQARLYRLATALAGENAIDDDVVFGAAWLHDLGVFIGHRPADPAALVAWDHIGYACRQAPGVLERAGFPVHKIPAVLEVIRTHMPRSEPVSLEGCLVHDADILEQLGGVGILRTVSKVGQDTRFRFFSDALRALGTNAEELASQLTLESARTLALPRLRLLREFLSGCEQEAQGIEW
ncbi:MAG TPA: HD domain-containing protein [Clostridia bacterium]|nr:HD domain-containing protein [Clostridia bacterium]